MVAGIGLQMQSVAIAWEVYERTNSAMALGLAGGQAADVFDRRRIVILSQVVFALAAGGLAVISATHGPIWGMYALLVVAGAARAFNSPARAALLPLIVEPEVFANAVTWNSGMFQVAAIAGPALGGLLIAATHTAWVVYVCAAGAGLVFAVGLAGVRPRATEPRATPHDPPLPETNRPGSGSRNPCRLPARPRWRF